MGDLSIDNLARIWRSVSLLCAELPESDFDRHTACPGWTVQDQLSHMIGTEALILGRPQPGTIEFPPPHVKNDIGKLNEAAVQYRRGWAPADVVAEFDEVMSQRLEQLDEMSDEELDEDSWTPAGPGSYRDLLSIRVLDCWVHEQDIRETVDLPGHLEGPAPEQVLQRMFLSMPFVVAKKAGAGEGSVVRFEITGPTSGELVVGVTGGRGRALEGDESGSAKPTTTVTGDFQTYTRVCAGRHDPEVALAMGHLSGHGDEHLAEAVIKSLPFMI